MFLHPTHWFIILTWLIHESSSLGLHPNRTTANSFDFSPVYNNLWLQRLCKIDIWLYDGSVNSWTADVSGVRTHGAHHPGLTYHNANIENISIEEVTKFLSNSEFYILRIFFSTHWLPPKTTTMKFSPWLFVNLWNIFLEVL